jgi:glycerophosphoryl diester phosphodiesterase
MPAFEYAIGAGAHVLEMDLAVTRDDVLVTSHDPVLPAHLCGGGRGTRVIREMTFAELREWDCGAGKIPGVRVPSLDEVLALAPRGAFEFNIETKIFARRPHLTPPPERFAELLLAAIRRHGLERRVIVQSFDFRTLHAMKKLAPEIRLSALDQEGKEDFATTARRAGASIISPRHNLVTPEKVKAAHAAGLQVAPWTANTPAEWDRLIAAGVDAIITDDPAALLSYLKKKR